MGEVVNGEVKFKLKRKKRKKVKRRRRKKGGGGRLNI